MPGLVSFYDIRPGNGAGLFFSQPREARTGRGWKTKSSRPQRLREDGLVLGDVEPHLHQVISLRHNMAHAVGRWWSHRRSISPQATEEVGDHGILGKEIWSQKWGQQMP